jgi:hypothetical protein
MNKKERLEIARQFKYIWKNDKTYYPLFPSRKTKDRLNRFGETPSDRLDESWQTPAEIAEYQLRIMGFNSPNDVPERKPHET